MQTHFINGAAVLDAIRLADAFAALSEIYRQGDLTDDDRASQAHQRYQDQLESGAGVGLNADWVRHCTLQDLAAQSLDQALRHGGLTAWTIAPTIAEIALAPAAFEWAALPENESQVTKTGVFRATSQYAGWEFNGATLWLKWVDWELFQATAKRDRLGIAMPVQPSKFSMDEIKSWIGQCSFSDMKSARTNFMLLPRSKGLSASFEAVWRESKPRGRGRPTRQTKQNGT